MRHVVHSMMLLLLLVWAQGAFAAPKASRAPAAKTKTERAETSAPVPVRDAGTLEIDVTDSKGNNVAARVELQGKDGGKPVLIEAPKGKLAAPAPAGAYWAYVYVYVLLAPVMVAAKDVTIKRGESAFLPVIVQEGDEKTLLFAYDQDFDFAIDRVEKECGTDPKDPASVPGRDKLPLDTRVLTKKEGWYRGELHAHSTYGEGEETVAQLVRRAEKAGLDFLAITDRNTMASCTDPEFKSDSVALIPAMEWGSDKAGVALIYGARTLPEAADTRPQGQVVADRTQAQGGFFAVGHPCFPTSPWQWGLSFVNGVEVWCRDWNAVPPLSLDALDESLKTRVKSKLAHSIAFAAATPALSANGQAEKFYDCELVRGLKAAVIGGSNTSNPSVPMGEPATYVYAVEKSVPALLDGMRRGRTYVSSGPVVNFRADILKNGRFDIPLGGLIPLGIPATFEFGVANAKGKEVEVMLNGYPLISKKIEANEYTGHFDLTPKNYSVIYVRVIDRHAGKNAFGAVRVLAITSPIYAQDIQVRDPQIEAYKHRIYNQPPPPDDAEVKLPEDPGPTELKPAWR